MRGRNTGLAGLNQTQGAAGVFMDSRPWNLRSRRGSYSWLIIHRGKNSLSSGHCGLRPVRLADQARAGAVCLRGPAACRVRDHAGFSSRPWRRPSSFSRMTRLPLSRRAGSQNCEQLRRGGRDFQCFEAGSYQITASAEAWIDVIQDGKSLASTAHGGKRDCPDVRRA